MYRSSSATISRGVRSFPAVMRSQFLDGDLIVGVDADAPSDAQRLFHDLARAVLRMSQQRDGGRLRERAAAADGSDAVVGLHHVAGARQDQRALLVGDYQ